MRRLALGLLALLVLPASAVAKGQSIAPPGNSGVQQYVETIPTAHGGQPTSAVHKGAGGSGHSVGGGTGTSGGSSGGGGAISSSTARTLDSQGSAGRAAAAFIQATAPSGARSANQDQGAGATNATTTGPASSGSSPATPQATGSSPASAVFHALTGSTASGGLGSFLPVILIASLLAISAATLILRRRRTT